MCPDVTRKMSLSRKNVLTPSLLDYCTIEITFKCDSFHLENPE